MEQKKQELTFAFYRKRWSIQKFFLMFGLLYFTMYPIYFIGYAITTHDTTWPWWNLIASIIGLCLSVFLWIVEIKKFMQQEPQFVLSEQGIAMHNFGFVPWTDVKSIALETIHKGRKGYYWQLQLQLLDTSLWQKDSFAWHQGVMADAFNFRKKLKLITIDQEYVSFNVHTIGNAYEQLAKHNSILLKIDHSGLYEEKA